ncbi:General secretion pathway protein A [hydrothermal vent metagenome]|uniref:General secretion pathway protein A n=1 Tax=hydrothermal vent metagenome TaxID=652676 RepID=A0A3B1ATX9_9ZZZZ
MYKSYFGFDESPFSITPDPKFIYMSRRHQDALAHLEYGLFETSGFVLLTGEVGTGKTALCRCMLEQLPATIDVAFILNPRQTALELLANICDELHISYPQDTSSIKVLIDLLNKYLLENHANGRRTILIIDEAQNLSDEVMEQIRLLTNLETSKHKLLQILLAGQPELQAMLDRPVLRQLTQRITARYHIAPLTLVETGAYIRHRMGVANVQRPIFSKSAISTVFKLCGGTPRLINIICDRALLGAYAQNADSINSKIVTQAAQEILPESTRSIFGPAARILAVAMLLVSFAVAAYSLRPWEQLELFKPSDESTVADSSASVIVPINPADNSPSIQKPPKESKAEDMEILAKAQTADVPELVRAPTDAEVSVSAAIKSNTEIQKSQLMEETTIAKDESHADTSASDLASILINQNCNSSSGTAISALFQLWGKEYKGQSGRTACDSARNEGLRCLHRSGTWNNLRRYNRPAIVELLNQDGNWQHLLVNEITEDSILLSCGDQSAKVTIGQADAHWFGEFLLLWQPPKQRLRFELGNKGSDVHLFREQIETALDIEHSTNDHTNEVFDKTLEEQVIQFQRTNLLQPDGVAGKDTIILLNTLAGDSSIPLLHP